MAKTTRTAAKEETPSSPQPRNRPNSTGTAIARLVAGVQHVPAFFMNPGYHEDSEKLGEKAGIPVPADNWYCLLPVQGNTIWVDLGISGYRPKGDLRELASVLIQHPDRAAERMCEQPIVLNPLTVQTVSVLVTVS